ncbi:hypothetical protein ALC152_03300 [Arcobacter sp. 15-2]|uniref:hypothetical protein n=1 Tax=Arcobacter sp. 15-2 TaxID=3374109 RepID=UPI00399CC3B9
MADVLTHLRELSFGYSILKEGITEFNDSPDVFLNFCKSNIKNCQHLTRSQISSKSEFSDIERDTIYNGLKLGRYIISKNILNSKANVKWLGNENQSGTTYDMEIDNIFFSLKEKSFILHNMGLYQLLNIITDKISYKKGLHIFEQFAPDALEKWFTITRQRTIDKLKIKSFQTEDSQRKNIKLAYSEEKLYLFYNGDEIKIQNFSECSYERFKNETTSKIREKVFSKFINQHLASDIMYLEAKKNCAEKAGKNLVDYLKCNVSQNPSPKSLYNLFRVTNQDYYYAKTTPNDIEVYKIPSQSEFSNNIQITDITYSVPSSQLNLLTTIENTDTKEKLIFRNELRYSHGQLNGTPEAKMYIDQGSLLIAYKSI